MIIISGIMLVIGVVATFVILSQTVWKKTEATKLPLPQSEMTTASLHPGSISPMWLSGSEFMWIDGDKVTITETKTVGSTTWGKTAKGWISLAYVKLDGSLENQKDIRTVTASCLKVRKGAGTGYKVVDYLYKGDKVEILEIKTVSGKKWGRIATGWISLEYTKQ